MTLSTYFVSFRIAPTIVDGRHPEDRHRSVVERARGKASFWDASLSFIMTQSTLLTPEFGAHVTADLSRDHDILIAFDPGDMSLCYFGPIEQENVLKSFFDIRIRV